MYIPRYPTLDPRYLLPRRASRAPQPFPMGHARTIFFDSGTTAICHAIRILGLAAGDRMLVPSYTCASIIPPIRQAGIAIDFYEVNEDLSLDRHDLERRLSGAKALLFIHYFGFPQDVSYLASVREACGVHLIEDCAHSFLSKLGEHQLGTVGDASVFSLRKTLPVTRVGALVVRPGLQLPATNGAQPAPLALRGHFGRLLHHVRFRLGIPVRTTDSRHQPSADQSDARAVSTPGNQGLSPLNGMLLKGLDYPAIVRTRRENFEFLLSRLRHVSGATPMFHALPPGVCPMAFPLVVPNRDLVCRLMNAHGVDAYPWPFLPDGISPNHPVADHLARTVLLLPIHQDLATPHLAAVSTSAERALLTSGRSGRA